MFRLISSNLIQRDESTSQKKVFVLQHKITGNSFISKGNVRISLVVREINECTEHQIFIIYIGHRQMKSSLSRIVTLCPLLAAIACFQDVLSSKAEFHMQILQTNYYRHIIMLRGITQNLNQKKIVSNINKDDVSKRGM